MRGSGKTTLSRNYADLNGYQFIDMDQLIFSQHNIISLKQFHEQNQNASEQFRKYESDLLNQLIHKEIKNPKLIISTGGGIVLKYENR